MGELNYEEAWVPHGHEEFGEDAPFHVHGPEADWSVSFGMPMTMRHDDNPDIIGMMVFRGIVLNMRAAMEERRESTNLAAMGPQQQQFTVIAYNADVILTESLMAVIDQALAANGINPPCQLQEVESSNIQSIGFVMLEPESLNGQPPADPEWGQLYIAFHGGTLYRYDDVPLELAEDLVAADSKGGFFHAYLKDGEYAYEKVI